MPYRIDIEERDIRAIEAALGDVSFDDEHRMAALRCSDSQDIQACPGSGKTTLLVAKLAILARKWHWNDRGILVLSHTNVAREEIQNRLSRIGGHKLLAFPHFVGTIQKFANQFLALPFLRGKGFGDIRIDNRLFGDRAVSLLENSKAYTTVRNFLANKPNIGNGFVRGLRYEGSDLALGCASIDLPCSPKSDSGKQLRLLKKQIWTEDRIFRYDDMFAFAERYLDQNKWISEALQHRFPLVFIDEMQDTDALQERIFESGFGEESVTQRIGDTNQAIFGSTYSKESVTSFPKVGALELPGSLRFCAAIAGLAKPLTRDQGVEDLIGNPNVPSKRHTIFTFDKGTIGKVLPAFGGLLQDEYKSGLPKKFRAKAVGARKTGRPANDDHFPFSISDYFDSFFPTASGATSFLEYATSGLVSFEETSNFADGWNVFIEGCLELLLLQDCFDKKALLDGTSIACRYSKTRLLDVVLEAGCGNDLRHLAFKLLSGRVNLRDSTSWNTFSKDLRSILARCLNTQGWNDDAKAFCQWIDLGSSLSVDSHWHPNCYIHKGIPPVPDIQIEIATIHSSKGETHTATLVLDTFNKTHDLKAVLPFLRGSMKKISPSDRMRMKRTFVAMTRPRELLCLALRRDHITAANRKKLESAWKFVDL